MGLFKNRTSERERALIADWVVKLEGKYNRVDGDDHNQLYNADASRVIYGSSFIIDASQKVKDGTEILGIEQNDESYSISASVAQANCVLAITITYVHEEDESWARSVIRSAHLRNV